MTIDTSATTITAITSALATLIGVVITGVISIIRTLHETRSVVVAGQQAGAAASVLRDQKLDSIHVLVNSRLVNVLRVVVALTKREADRTNLPDDVATYQRAVAELAAAEAAAAAKPHLTNEEEAQARERAADEAEKTLLELTTKKR